MESRKLEEFLVYCKVCCEIALRCFVRPFDPLNIKQTNAINVMHQPNFLLRVWLVRDNDWWLTVPDTVLDTWLCPGSRLVSPGPGY